MKDAPVNVRGGTVLGSGLSAVSYGVVLAISVGLFVGYGGPLWATRGSHGMRFAVSYLAVIPLVALVLRLSGRLTWPNIVTAVGTLWAIKLLVTAPLYYALAPGGALDDIGALPTARASTAVPTARTQTSAYKPADGPVPSGVLKGRVTAPSPVVVTLVAPPPGRSLPAAREVSVVLTDGGFERSVYLMNTADSLRIDNPGKRMHSARLRAGGRTRLNAPVPPGETAHAPSLDTPGEVELTCATHPTERALLIVVDHPYAVRTDDQGAFELEGVPAADVSVVAVDLVGDEVVRSTRTVRVREGAATELSLSFGTN